MAGFRDLPLAFSAFETCLTLFISFCVVSLALSTRIIQTRITYLGDICFQYDDYLRHVIVTRDDINPCIEGQIFLSMIIQGREYVNSECRYLLSAVEKSYRQTGNSCESARK